MLQIQDDPFSPERVELHPLAVVQAPGALHPFRERQVQRIEHHRVGQREGAEQRRAAKQRRKAKK